MKSNDTKFEESLELVRLIKGIRNRHTVNGVPPTEGEIRLHLVVAGKSVEEESAFRFAMRSVGMIDKV